MKFESQLVQTDYGHYIPIPEKLAIQSLEKFGKRVICYVKGEKKFHCAIQKKSNGFYIMVGKKTKKEIGLESNEIFALELLKDESKYQMELPLELEEVLHTDEEGYKRFEDLTPGKKRTIIHYVRTAKREQTRIDRSLRILENLKDGITDLKLLMK